MLKSRFGKVTAILVALAIVITSTFSLEAFAGVDDITDNAILTADVPEGGDIIGEGEGGTQNPGENTPGEDTPGEGEDENTFKIRPAEKEGSVCRMYVGYRNRGFPSLGHVFVYFENLTDHPITIGLYEVPVGQGVSCGTFGLTRHPAGIYYNLEAFCGNWTNEDENKVKYQDATIYCEREMNQKEFDKVSQKVLTSNWYDPVAVNCVAFAFGCWNAGGGSFMMPLMLPVIGKLFIAMKRDHKRGGFEMYKPTVDQVLHQDGWGSSRKLVPCKESNYKKGDTYRSFG